MEGTDFGSGITMVVGICFVFGNFIGVLGADAALGHLFAHARIDLTHLRSLAHTVAGLEEIFGGFDCSTAGRGPDGKGL